MNTHVCNRSFRADTIENQQILHIKEKLNCNIFFLNTYFFLPKIITKNGTKSTKKPIIKRLIVMALFLLYHSLLNRERIMKTVVVFVLFVGLS